MEVQCHGLFVECRAPRAISTAYASVAVARTMASARLASSDDYANLVRQRPGGGGVSGGDTQRRFLNIRIQCSSVIYPGSPRADESDLHVMPVSSAYGQAERAPLRLVARALAPGGS